MPVGIEKFQAYPCSMKLDLGDLAETRGVDREYPTRDLLVRSRSVNPPWEDPVTMAVNAALRLVDEEDRKAIRLIVVGTESSLDFGKSIAVYVHRYCGIQPNCRAFETKHACYSGTSALMMAAYWVAATGGRDGKALVVTTDQSRVHLGEPWEYVLGATACAMLVSDQPDILEIELDRCGYWTSESFDTFRPTSMTEVGNADDSLYCYLDALEGAFDDFQGNLDGASYDKFFSRHVYHVPFGKITEIAHRTLTRQGRRMKASQMRESFERKVAASLSFTSECGGTYSSSTALGLLGHLASPSAPSPGERISVFAFGSGSTAEFYSVVVGPHAQKAALKAEITEQLSERSQLSVKQYEAVEGLRVETTDKQDFVVDRDGFDDLYQRSYKGHGRLVLDGVENWVRKYRVS